MLRENKTLQTLGFWRFYREKSAYIYQTLGCDVQFKYFNGGQGPYPVGELPLQI